MSHINALVNVNGIPYLLGEYLDNRSWQQLNEYDVTNEIIIDTSEAMRAVIDISLRDIPLNQDGSMYVVGNNSLSSILLGKINKYYNKYCGKLDVLKNTLKIKVNYQLENASTGQIIRSTIEEFRLNNRSFFVKINVNNTNDNPILTNFYNTIVSNITQFTHGRERMLLRITHIQLFYECVRPNPLAPRVGDTMRIGRSLNYQILPESDNDMYEYHRHMQSSQLFPDDGINQNGTNFSGFNPPRWAMNTAFYHFEDNYNSIILHENEIYDRKMKILEIPCGQINVNRAFYINPGHQLVFKFSIWKNDIAIINNPIELAKSLHIANNEYQSNVPIDYHHSHHIHHDHTCDNDLLYKMLVDRKEMDYKQNDTINKINNIITNKIYPALKSLQGEAVEDNLDTIENLPVKPDIEEDNYPLYKPHDPIGKLFQMTKNILKEIKALQEKDKEIESNIGNINDNYQELTEDNIEDIVQNAVDSTKPSD